MPRIDALLQALIDRGGSDLHLAQGNPPLVRVHGELEAIYGALPLKPNEPYDDLILEILEPHHRERFATTNDVDAAYAFGTNARFRVNVFRQNAGIGCVMRVIPTKIRPLTEMNLPPVVERFTKMSRGLVLVTGPTGSGKSTTLAAVLDAINKSREGHIITIEDPLEFVHQNQKCLITHREIGSHAKSFADALRAAMRQNPDVILVGEMRDMETMSMALAACETGILVFGTLHTNSAAKTVDRMVDAFPETEQEMVRGVLAENLKGVVSQHLLRTADGKGRVAAIEVMIGTHAIGNLIREGKTPMISSAIQSAAADGMVAMDKSLADLVNSQKITFEAGSAKAMDKEYFQKLVKGQPG